MVLRMKAAPAAALAIAAALGAGAAFAAPAQLYGKSVVVAWSETRERKVGAQTVASTFTRHGEFSAYVSSAGRVFNRLTFSAFVGSSRAYPRFQSASSDQINSEGPGQARSVAFSGRTMTSVTMMDGGAQRILVTFADDFSSCSAEILTGKSTGAARIHARGEISGAPLEILSVRTGAASCKLQAGNVFGN